MHTRNIECTANEAPTQRFHTKCIPRRAHFQTRHACVNTWRCVNPAVDWLTSQHSDNVKSLYLESKARREQKRVDNKLLVC